MRIAITGGAGVVGTRLVRELAATPREIELRILDLPSAANLESMARLGHEVVPTDICCREDLDRALEGCEVVVHLAAALRAPGREAMFRAINDQGTANVVEAAKVCGCRRLVQVSSISVHYLRQNSYSRSKRLAESRVLNSGLPQVHIARPTLACGVGGGVEFQSFVDRIRHWPILPLVSGGRALKAPVHVDDLCVALRQLCLEPLPLRGEWDLPGGEVLSLATMARRIAQVLGLRRPLVSVPYPLAKAMVSLLERTRPLAAKADSITWQTLTGMVENAVGDPRLAQAHLRWAPRGFGEFLPHLGLEKRS